MGHVMTAQCATFPTVRVHSSPPIARMCRFQLGKINHFLIHQTKAGKNVLLSFLFHLNFFVFPTFFFSFTLSLQRCTTLIDLRLFVEMKILFKNEVVALISDFLLAKSQLLSKTEEEPRHKGSESLPSNDTTSRYEKFASIWRITFWYFHCFYLFSCLYVYCRNWFALYPENRLGCLTYIHRYLEQAPTPSPVSFHFIHVFHAPPKLHFAELPTNFLLVARKFKSDKNFSRFN